MKIVPAKTAVRFVEPDAYIGRTSRGKYICPVCGTTWASLDDFWLYHLNKPHYRCDRCGYYYVGLRGHQARAHRASR